MDIVCVCSIYTMRHCLQGPCQGPLQISPKGNVILYDKTVKKIKIMMILLNDFNIFRKVREGATIIVSWEI